ncbi:coiled-coil domain-containing protein 74B [Fundulus diaphanus]
MSGRPNNLPPLWHSPDWTRVGIPRKSGSPRRFPTSQPLHPLPAVPLAVRGAAEGPGAPEASRLSQVDPRVSSLQRNIQFLQQQHQETLEKLHAEVEYLRKENKELKYKLIMESHKTSRKGMRHSLGDARPPTQSREAHIGLYLEEPLEDTTVLLQDRALSSREGDEVPRPARQNNGADLTGKLITSLQPLRIHSSPSHPPRAPTLQECEVIIRQLFNANSLQSQEIARVKALLRDIVLSKKITAEHHILSKAYLVDGPCKPVEAKKFPKLGLQSFQEKTSGPSSSGVVLPALKQSLSSNVANRQRRTRAVHRDHLKWSFH